jgi:predicted  nucleic acid-binding Zn-ribbon protein
MKKSIGLLTASLFLSGAVFTSCKTEADKVEDAQENVVDAKENEMDAQQDLNEAKYENASDYTQFKEATKLTIAENETRIAEFKVKLKTETAANQAKFQAKVDDLEKRNDQLEDDINDFTEGANENWNDFKNRIERSTNDIEADIEAYKREHNY